MNDFKRILVLASVGLSLALHPVELAEAASGSDIAYGYTWRDIDDGATYEFLGFDSWTDEAGPYDDVVFGPLPLELANPFPFYGQLYDSFYITDNGFLVLEDSTNPQGPPATAEPVPSGLPSGFIEPQRMIAPFWTDMEMDLASRVIRYGPTTGDRFRIQWSAWDKFASQAIIMEVLLYPEGRIKFQYASGLSSLSPGNATIGIENEDGSDGIGLMQGGAVSFGIELRPGYVVEFFPRPILPDVCGDIPLDGCTVVNDSTLTSTLPGISYYSCEEERYAATGTVRSFTLTEASDVSLDLTSATGGLRMFLLTDCSEQACIGNGAETNANYTLGAGTYYVAIDGLTGADDGDFTLTVSCTPIGAPEICGNTWTDSTAGGSSRWDNYGCAGLVDLSGTEAIYSVNVPVATNLRATLLAAAADVDVLVLKPEEGLLGPEQCVAHGDNGSVAWDAQPGEYLIVVDGRNGASGAFEIETECNISLDCSAPVGVVDFNLGRTHDISGDTTGIANNVSVYSCDPSLFFDGGEEVWEVTLDQPGQVAIYQTDGSPLLSYFFTTSCNEGACVGAAVGSSCAGELDAGTYFLVVDSPAGEEGPYDLKLVYEETFNRWSECQAAVLPQTTPETESSTFWNLSDGAFCITDPRSFNYPDGCVFAMYATVRCGTAMHIPFYDTEGGHIRIFDVFAGEYVVLTARSDGGWSQTGTEIQWQDEDCESGSDPRWNEVTTDVFFEKPEGLCGVYRLEFINHSGNVWELYSNCTGTNTPQFNIHDSLCTALADYDPVPEVTFTSASAVLDCPDIEVTYEITNIGCSTVYDFPVALSSPDVDYTDIVPSIAPGQTLTRSFMTTFATVPTGAVFVNVDFDDIVVECNDTMGIGCGELSRMEAIPLPGCAASCQVIVAATVTPTERCGDDGQTFDINASASSSLCPGDAYEFRIFDGSMFLPWQTSGDFLGIDPAMSGDFTIQGRCEAEPDCEDQVRIPFRIDERPIMDDAQVIATDLASCNPGVRIDWPAAIFQSGTGTYTVLRSAISCDDILMGGGEVLAGGLDALSYTYAPSDGTAYYYVVQAEDSIGGSACLPVGATNGGSTYSVCANGGTPLVDITTPDLAGLPRNLASLRLGGTGGYGIPWVRLTWTTDIPLDEPAGDHAHVRRIDKDGLYSGQAFDLHSDDGFPPNSGLFDDFFATQPATGLQVLYYKVWNADVCEGENTAFDHVER